MNLLNFKAIFFFLALLPALTVHAQQKIELIQAEEFYYDATRGDKVQVVKGNVIFRQGDVTLRCDSAVKYEVTNMLEAVGNVHINQADSVFLDGNKLFYDGNTRQARLVENVRLTDRDMVLTTDELQYDMNNKVGYYTNNARIVSKNNTLTSVTGSYYSRSKEFFFRKNVELSNPEYKMKSDTLKYNTVSRVAYFFGPTTITSEDNTIYCEYGWYDTQKDQSQFSKSASLVSKENTLTADSLLYNRRTGLGQAFGHIVITDTIEKLVIYGDIGEYNRKTNTALVTRNPLASKLVDDDSLLMVADSFMYKYDTASKARRVFAYHHVKLFKTDMQGVCDSLYYSSKDSIMSLYTDPVLWSDANQLTGDTIHVRFAGNGIQYMDLKQNGFIASQEDSVKYNQIKGRDMRGLFANNKLYRVNVNGNGQSIYYAREDSVSYTGMNVITCSDMIILLTDSNKVKTITFLTEPEGVFYPPNEFSQAQTRLKGFRWLARRRPPSKAALRNRETELLNH